MILSLSLPFAVGHTDLPLAVATATPGDRIKTLVGRRDLLGLRGEALAAVGVVELMRAFGRPSGWGEPHEVGVIVCSSTAADDAVTAVNQLCLEQDTRSISILDAPNVSPNVVSSVVSIRAGAHGPSFTLDDPGGQAEALLDLAHAVLGSGTCRTVLAVETCGDGLGRAVGFELRAESDASEGFRVEWDRPGPTGAHPSLVDLAISCAATMRSRSGTDDSVAGRVVRRVPRTPTPEETLG